MPVVILCGGSSTRMRGSSGDDRPKPLVEVGDQPVVWHVMKIYAHYGYTDFVLALGYRGEMIKNYFLDYLPMSRDVTLNLGETRDVTYHAHNDEEQWRVTLTDTGTETQTGARIKKIERYIDTPTFFATYSDGVGDIDLNALLKFHRAHGKLATVTGVRPFSQFGLIETDGDRVTGFREKPQVEGHVNGGFFVFERGVFDYLRGPDTLELEKEPLVNLARDGQLMIYRHDRFWRAMDTLKDAQVLNDLWKNGSAPWKIW
ncbi:MAG TPA: glucose-1-phosphate cytidylyltransferase [Anaerolineae bacterium]|nr:glucose-1-phosphate cytidylyltransferase [Anaerolineae bacterium]